MVLAAPALGNALRPGVREHRFHAMGTACHLIVVGGGATSIRDATARIDDLERRWSRFRHDSEVSRLNQAGGRAVGVSDDTVQLLAAARRAWGDTGGGFDPTVLPWLESAGYDDDIARVRGRSDGRATGPAAAPPALPPAGLGVLELDDVRGTARLPAGVRVDPGGIGKGLAADVVVAELLSAGAAGALTSLGGDLRVAGTPPVGDAWGIDVAPEPDVRTARFALCEGAVATSTTALRRWRRGGRWQHHAIDPSTGRPAVAGPRSVTVVAGRAWRAEALATALLVTPAEARRSTLVTAPGAGAVVIGPDGRSTHLGAIEEYLR